MFWLFNLKEILTSAQLSSQIHVWQKTDYISSSNFPHAWKELVETLYDSPRAHRAAGCSDWSESKNNFQQECGRTAQLCVPTLAREACLLHRPPLLPRCAVLDQLKGSRVSARELWVGLGWRYPQSGWMLNEIYGVLCLIINFQFKKITDKYLMHPLLKRRVLEFGKFTFLFG